MSLISKDKIFSDDKRRCRIRAPICNEVFYCRHCHNEAKNFVNVKLQQRHDVPRHKFQGVICSLCDTQQDVHQVCINCGVCMGKYFCETCKLLMMISQNSNSTVMDMVYVELGAGIISSTVSNVVVSIRLW